MMNKLTKRTFLLLFFVFAFVSIAAADTADQITQRWTKSHLYKGEDQLSNLLVSATYYSAEYIDAYIQQEAKKNLWTQQELEDYKYKFLNILKLDEMIPVHIAFDNNSSTMYLGPFDIMVGLRIGNTYYKPIDYDKRFNFKFQGKKDGLVYFKRYDDKTGKDLLKGVKQVTLELKPTIQPEITSGRTTKFLWDISKDDPQKLFQGTTMAKMETDRLLKRLEKIRKDKADEQVKLNAITDEETTIKNRLDELAKQ
ncbi:MAG: hypothetical protein RRY12_12625 [Cloacibacillus sp.]